MVYCGRNMNISSILCIFVSSWLSTKSISEKSKPSFHILPQNLFIPMTFKVFFVQDNQIDILPWPLANFLIIFLISPVVLHFPYFKILILELKFSKLYIHILWNLVYHCEWISPLQLYVCLNIQIFALFKAEILVRNSALESVSEEYNIVHDLTTSNIWGKCKDFLRFSQLYLFCFKMNLESEVRNSSYFNIMFSKVRNLLSIIYIPEG